MLMLFTSLGLLFLSAVVISAQSPTYSGNWKLETNFSLIPPDFLAMKVSQNASELKVELVTKPNNESGVQKTQSRTYDLTGHQTVMYEDGNTEKVAATLNANLQADGSLVLNMNRFMTDKNESFTLERKSVWELVDNGKKLKVTEFVKLPEGATNVSDGVSLYYVREN